MRIEIAEPGRMTQTGSSLLKLIQNNNMPVLDLLVRESIQNSLDAKKESSKYVEVDYLTGQFDSHKLGSELEGITSPLFERFPNARYDYIAVRDSNTVGLTGELDYKKVKNNDYGNLLKLIYEICKPQEAEGAGGSWGLGKTVYFRMGIGLVIYYSRIKTGIDSYASRLAASYVENEMDPDAMIPVYKDQAKRGIAWWGDLIGENITQPVTDENYIHDFLEIFGIEQYSGDETGTTIIIPYIDSEKLLANNQVEYLDGKGQTVIPYWCKSIEEYLSIAAQRWYAPRLNNIHYTLGAFLRMKINEKGLGLDDMEPVFKVIQALYNRANFVTEEDILTNTDAVVKVEGIRILKYLDDTNAGNVSFAKVSRELLGMTAPHNKPEPYMYFNCEIRDEDVNKPTICFARKPAMIVSYENVGAWASNISPTTKDEYILAIFVLNSFDSLKNSPNKKTLEEYVRKSEMADHTSWSDWSEGSFNPRIVTKIQSGVNKTISKEFAPIDNNPKPKVNSGLGKLFGDMLLPPDGFGKQAGPGPNPDGERKPAKRKGFNFVVDAGKIKYLPDKMIVPFSLETSGKKKISYTGFEMQIDSESKKIAVNEWEGKMGLLAPFSVDDCKINLMFVDGKKVDASYVLRDGDNAIELEGINFSKRETGLGTCFGMRINAEEPHSLKVRIVVTIQLNRRDVKPSFVFEKEESNG